MEYSNKRNVDILVLSDIHLGTYGCHARELYDYLSSVNPDMVILNGDIIDMWQFRKRFWPNEHMKIIQKFIEWMSQGIPVYYLCGNHDEMLRRFCDSQLGNLHIQNKMVVELANQQKAWFFHGDVFDVSMKHSKWAAKLGGMGYNALIRLNRMANFISENVFDKGKFSFSKRIKNSVKHAVNHISNFEQTVAEIAINNQYDYVVCGHIHQPVIKTLVSEHGSTVYMNSGDWVENLTALEYHEGEWRLYYYPQHVQGPVNQQQATKHDAQYDSYNHDVLSGLLEELTHHK